MNILHKLETKHKAILTRYQSLKAYAQQLSPTETYVGNKPKHNTTHKSCQIENFYRYVVVQDLILQCPVRGTMELVFAPKVVINTTSKRFAIVRRQLTTGLAALLLISGQRGQPTTARKSIAAFQLRQGTVLGCKVTLRGKKGYCILDKLITFVLPRGYPSHVRATVDTTGNWGVGISDPLLFVELQGQYDLFRSLEGIGVSIVVDKRRRPIVLLVATSLQLMV